MHAILPNQLQGSLQRSFHSKPANGQCCRKDVIQNQPMGSAVEKMSFKTSQWAVL
jgi:hypothetical protein